jgi:alcohol dehydrogenase class IV
MSNLILLPRILRIGAGASAELPALLATMNCKRPFFVTDAVMVELGVAARIRAPLEESGLSCGMFENVEPEPSENSILGAVESVRTGEHDVVVAIGGGSAIDSAKAIAVLGKLGGRMRDYRVPRDVSEPVLPVVAIPTTAGTGSEVTRFTVITDAERGEKMLCTGAAFVPMAALIDYELTLTLPPRATADSGLDALTHAIEAYVSRKANPYSDSQALAALRLIEPNLRTVFFHSPGDRAAREAMMLGSTLAGVAFSSASVALVHGMSRPIGAKFHVPHGMSNAILLPAVTEFSLPAAYERYATVARAMGVARDADSDADAGRKLVQELKDLNNHLHVPSLQQYGIAEDVFFESLESMADQALASGSPANNPLSPDRQEIIDLYERVWSQETAQ